MKRFQGIRRLAVRGSVAILVAVMLAGLGVFLPWPAPAAVPAGHDVQLFVATNGMHTDLVLPVATPEFDWWTFFHAGDVYRRTGFAPRYLSFGWGERDFYLNAPDWDQVTMGQVMHSLLFSDGSLMHVEAHGDVTPSENVLPIAVSSAAYLDLVRYIADTFRRAGDGSVTRVADGYGDTDAFFEAVPHYGFWRTCNSWTAEGLRQIGQPTPLWSGTAVAVMRHLSRQQP